MKKLLLIALALVFALSAVAMAEEAAAPKYVFMFIGDGMGNPQVAATQYYLGSIENPDSEFPVPGDLSFTTFPYLGMVYAVQHKSETVRAASRSGGIFTAVSDWVISQNGIVYGCVLDESFRAVHIRTVCAEDRDRMRGSKYIQSKLGDTYKNVRIDLTNGRIVLFTGTSCEVAGLKQYLGKEYENLICVDIVCHGVPSPKVWGEYLHWQEGKNNAKVLKVDFRNKTDFGWRAHKVYYCLNSLLRQTVQPYKIILWLAKEQFPNEEGSVPTRILKLKEYGLDIQF